MRDSARYQAAWAAYAEPWRMVEVARSKCADPMWGERDSWGRFTWHDGTAPAKPGVVCDLLWQPVHAEDLLADMAPPVGGFHREQVAAQRRAREGWPLTT